MKVVQISDLHFSREGRPVLSGIDLEVERGEIIAIMGPSGTGKTTLLKLITGQLKPERGELLVFGEPVDRLPRKRLFALRHRIGMLFQSGALLSDLDLFENVAFPIREHTDLPEPLIRTLVLMKLEAVGLRGARRLMPSQLSGGMARRGALARAIALDPELILYDEPFTGQDPINKGILMRLIRDLNRALGLTSILVSHDVREACTIADRVYLLAAGRIVASGEPEVLLKSERPEVKQFMHGFPDGPVPFHYPAPDYREDLLGEAA